MNFKTALTIYCQNIDNLQHRYLRGIISEEARDAGLFQNHFWFRQVLLFDDIHEYFKEVYLKDLDDEVIKKYNTSPEDYTLCSVIYYRDKEIPCYDDDYGQQVFARIGSKEISGGAYNLYYAELFCEEVDYILEQERLEELEKEYINKKQ